MTEEASGIDSGQAECRQTADSLETLSQWLDGLDKKPPQEQARLVDWPENLLPELKFRRTANPILGPNSRPVAAVVKDVGVDSPVNISCFEVRQGKRTYFTVACLDKQGNWHLYVKPRGGKVVDAPSVEFEESTQKGAKFGNIETEGFELRLKPLSSPDILDPGYDEVARFSPRITKGKSVRVRTLPVQLVRKSLGLAPKEKIPGTFYYPSITSQEMAGIVTQQTS